MTRLHLLLAWVPALLACGAAAADDVGGQPQTGATLRVFDAVERLSNDTPDWRETGAGLLIGFAPRHALDLAAADVHRFGLHDSQYAAGYTLPLSSELTASIEGDASPTHRVLARQSLGMRLQYEFAPAWLAHAGIKSSSYDATHVNQALFMLEHYVSDFSWSVGWRPTRALGVTAHGAEVRGSYYYGNRNALTLIAAAGREAASIPGGVALADVRSVALTGRHWLDRRWALIYGADHTRQGSLYTRNGINLGIQAAF